jgi:hypothetical protein
MDFAERTRPDVSDWKRKAAFRHSWFPGYGPIAQALRFLLTCLLSNAMNGTTRRFAAEDARAQPVPQAVEWAAGTRLVSLLKLFIKS